MLSVLFLYYLKVKGYYPSWDTIAQIRAKLCINTSTVCYFKHLKIRIVLKDAFLFFQLLPTECPESL